MSLNFIIAEYAIPKAWQYSLENFSSKGQANSSFLNTLYFIDQYLYSSSIY